MFPEFVELADPIAAHANYFTIENRTATAVCVMGQHSVSESRQYIGQRNPEMLPCKHCSKEVPPEMALLTQDLDTNPLVFCSTACYEMWFDNLLAPLPTTAHD